MATFDIVIPAYNAAKYLSEAIDSVIAQDYDDWRILLVNDGSTDATGEIAERYRQQLGDRMLVLTQPNAGMSAARNAALGVANAEFVAMLDADDLWLPDRLRASLASFAARPAAGLSYGLNAHVNEDGKVFFTFAGNPAFAEGRIAPQIYKREVELPCPTVTIRRSCLAEVGYFDRSMRATEDRDLWLRIALRYEVAFVPKVIAHYRVSAGSTSSDMDHMMRGQFRFIDKHFGAPGCGRMARRIARARVWKQRGEIFHDRHRPWQAAKSAWRACLIWPFGLDNLRTAASLSLRLARVR